MLEHPSMCGKHTGLHAARVQGAYNIMMCLQYTRRERQMQVLNGGRGNARGWRSNAADMRQDKTPNQRCKSNFVAKTNGARAAHRYSSYNEHGSAIEAQSIVQRCTQQHMRYHRLACPHGQVGLQKHRDSCRHGSLKSEASLAAMSGCISAPLHTLVGQRLTLALRCKPYYLFVCPLRS
jgi:hypothetical protein